VSPKLMRVISRRTEDSISRFAEIRANNTFSYEENLFRKGLEDSLRINMEVQKVFGITTFLSNSFSQIATLSVYAVGGWLAIKSAGVPDGVTVGAIFVMVRALATVINPIKGLIDYFQRPL